MLIHRTANPFNIRDNNSIIVEISQVEIIVVGAIYSKEKPFAFI